MTDRMDAYRSYFDEVTPNGNTRMENIILCAGPKREHEKHIKRQVTFAFYGGWRMASAHVAALLKAERERALREAAQIAERHDANDRGEGSAVADCIRAEILALLSEDKTDG